MRPTEHLWDVVENSNNYKILPLQILELIKKTTDDFSIV